MNPYPQFRQNLIPKSNIVSFSTDPAGIRSMIERLTVFCMEAGVAIIYVHHHSKGNQALKESLDRGSGAGSWSRDPDCVIDLADQDESTKENPIFSAEVTVGDFPSIQKFVVCWQFPVLLRDDVGRDPDNLKKPNKAGRPPSDASEQF